MEFFIFAFSSYIALLNPFLVLPNFVSLIQGRSSEEVKRIALIGPIVAGIILLICGFVGYKVLSFFGITIMAFRFGGGILLLLISLDMLRATSLKTKTSDEEEFESKERDHVAIFPVAIPFMAGPGAITSTFMLAQKATILWDYLIIIFTIVFFMILNYICFRFAPHIMKRLGNLGKNIMVRLMGIILISISSQYLFDSITELALLIHEKISL